MKVKGHHVYGAGFLTGLAVASYREWLLLATALLCGCLVTILVYNARAAKRKVSELLAAREEREYARLAIQHRDAETRHDRQVLAQAKADEKRERVARLSQGDEVPF